jgi:predicted small secreted protein
MKKLLLSIAVIAMLTTACNGKKTDGHGDDHTDGTHQHADGEEHANHESDTVAQEEFTVGKDTAAAKEAHDHQHESGEEHQH